MLVAASVRIGVRSGGALLELGRREVLFRFARDLWRKRKF